MNFKKLKSQSGRSMVEMLGVLAIIGVLSVGGIAGYSLSMRRHRANQIVDLASKYALVLYSNCQQKLVNGDVTFLNNCSLTENPTFADAGVGNLPAGVKFRVSNTGSQSRALFSDNGSEGPDTVAFSASFDDDKLCQAVGSITGTGCNDNIVYILIKQN